MTLLSCSFGFCGLHFMAGVCLAATLAEFTTINPEPEESDMEGLAQASLLHQEQCLQTTKKTESYLVT
jgi:hypothetical protein